MVQLQQFEKNLQRLAGKAKKFTNEILFLDCRKVGGVGSSQHLIVKAAGITIKSKTPKQIHAIIEKLIIEKKIQQ